MSIGKVTDRYGTAVTKGPQRWGYVQLSHARHRLRLRLVIYPPGTSPEEIMWLRLWQLLPLIVIALLVTAGSVAASSPSLLVAMVIATGVVAATGVATGVVAATGVATLARRGASLRRSCVVMDTWLSDDRPIHDARLPILDIASRLDSATRMRDADELSPVVYECIWAECYERAKELTR